MSLLFAHTEIKRAKQFTELAGENPAL